MKFVNGLLTPEPGEKFKVFHFQTREVGRRSANAGRLSKICGHYTACKAEDAKNFKLDDYMNAAKLGESEKDTLRREIGSTPIPSIVALALRGAGDERESSWDFGVGDGPKDYLDGCVPIVQCNLEIPIWYTWNAGQSVKDFLRHSPGKTVTNVDGQVVWDGDSFVWPFPGRNTNPSLIGIENELYGAVYKDGKRVMFDPDGKGSYEAFEVTKRVYDVVEFKEGNKTKLYEKPHPLQLSAYHNLLLALCREYKIAPENIIDHRRIRPDNRTDAEPPFILKEARDYVSFMMGK